MVRHNSTLVGGLLALLGISLSGCVVRTAEHVAMVPVHAASWTVDKMTTSPSEAERNRDRDMRKQEERQAKEQRRGEQQPDDGAGY